MEMLSWILKHQVFQVPATQKTHFEINSQQTDLKTFFLSLTVILLVNVPRSSSSSSDEPSLAERILAVPKSYIYIPDKG